MPALEPRWIQQLQTYGFTLPAAFDRYLRPLRKTEWVVYAKPPFEGPARVLAYLGLYTHRVAISGDRLLDIEDDRIQKLCDGTRDRRPSFLEGSCDADESYLEYALEPVLATRCGVIGACEACSTRSQSTKLFWFSQPRLSN